MKQLAAIFGVEGPRLTAAELAFFRDSNPWGFILFGRNIETPEQVKALTSSLRECIGRDCLIFIDQEGGRVQRLKPPHWHNYPSLSHVAETYEDNADKTRRAIFLHHRLIAHDLRALGINANCAPVLDIPVKGANPIISDRALGESADQVIDLAHAAISGLMAGGVAPVIKHIPGHGRAKVDSHLALPRIEASLDALNETDFKPFRALHDAPMAMTAHIVVDAIDPTDPVTLSQKNITFLRDQIGFNGLLMSDDLDMKALSGSLTDNTHRALKAGCDIALQCSGKLPAMVNVAKGAKNLSGEAKARAGMAFHCAQDPQKFNYAEGFAEYKKLTTREELSA